MLGKILKYDLKSCLRFYPPAIAAALCVLAIGLLSRIFKVVQLQATVTFLLVIIAVVFAIGAYVIMIVRFYKSVFGSEGYLYGTLPVKKGTLLASKVITAYACLICGFVLSFASLFGIIFIFDLSWANDVKPVLDMIFGSVYQPLLVYLIITMAVQSLSFIAQVYASVALAHTRAFAKNSILFSVIFYLAANFIAGMLEMLAMFAIPLGIIFTDGGIKWTTKLMLTSFFDGTLSNQTGVLDGMILGIGNIFADIAVAAGLILFTRWIMQKKASVK